MAPDPEIIGSFFILITVFDNIYIVIIDIDEIISNEKNIKITQEMKNALPIALSIGEKPSRRKEDKIGP